MSRRDSRASRLLDLVALLRDAALTRQSAAAVGERRVREDLAALDAAIAAARRDGAADHAYLAAGTAASSDLWAMDRRAGANLRLAAARAESGTASAEAARAIARAEALSRLMRARRAMSDRSERELTED